MKETASSKHRWIALYIIYMLQQLSAGGYCDRARFDRKNHTIRQLQVYNWSQPLAGIKHRRGSNQTVCGNYTSSVSSGAAAAAVQVYIIIIKQYMKVEKKKLYIAFKNYEWKLWNYRVCTAWPRCRYTIRYYLYDLILLPRSF